MPRWDVNFEMQLNNTSVELRTLVANINAVARLTGDMVLTPAAEGRLNALNIYRAVRGTTGIEGASLTTDEVEQILSRPGERVLSVNREREEQEARNAAEVMAFTAGSDAETVSEPLILNIHNLTTQNINYLHNVPGQYRSHPAEVGSYLPPETHDEVRDLMARFVEWINSGERLHWDAIIRGIVSHFYLVSIHPFGDGNGRTARGVEGFFLYKGGINRRGFYSLANFYYENRAEYFEMLDRVRFETQNDLTPFVLFALRGLEAELEWVRSEIVTESRWIAFRDFARERCFGSEGPRTPAVALRLFRFAVGLPKEGIHARDVRSTAMRLVSDYEDLGNRTLMRDIERLVDMEILRVDDDYLYPNAEVMDAFTAPSVPIG